MICLHGCVIPLELLRVRGTVSVLTTMEVRVEG
jgi:hypothetical protein